MLVRSGLALPDVEDVMYHPLHEADIEKFVITMETYNNGTRRETQLKRLRAYAKLSQQQLADKSGVPLRQIQLFEQRQRDINKTQAATLLKLARALGCSCEQLVEP